MQRASKNDDSSLCQDVIITHPKILKLTNFVIFRVISIITVGQTYLEMLSPNQCDPRRPKVSSGGHKVSASRAYIYIYILGCSKKFRLNLMMHTLQKVYQVFTNKFSCNLEMV